MTGVPSFGRDSPVAPALRLAGPPCGRGDCLIDRSIRRILVTGNAGAGKSTLGREVARVLGLPFHSLDRIVWQPGWKRTSREDQARMIAELTSGERWVIDGVSFEVQECADAVVFLDVPRRVAFRRVFLRNWRFLFRSRPELPPRCPEILIVPALCRIIWRFPGSVRDRLLERMERCRGRQRQFHLRTEGDVRAFLATLAGEARGIAEGSENG